MGVTRKHGIGKIPCFLNKIFLHLFFKYFGYVAYDTVGEGFDRLNAALHCVGAELAEHIGVVYVISNSDEVLAAAAQAGGKTKEACGFTDTLRDNVDV